MNGYDIISGNVSDIIDEENIYIEPRRDGVDRVRERPARKRIRIHRIKLDDVVWLTGRFSRKLLESILWRRNVTCRIKSLGRGGAIFADVYLS
jgi:hypothetical protein